jgi:hypothetical protein
VLEVVAITPSGCLVDHSGVIDRHPVARVCVVNDWAVKRISVVSRVPKQNGGAHGDGEKIQLALESSIS